MFEEPVVVLEGQPLRVAFQTNLDIANGGGTRFSPDQQGQSSKAPDLYLEVGNNEWLPWTPDDQGFHTRPDNWLMRWYQGNVTQQTRAYGIELKHAAVGDHGNWTVSIESDTQPVKREDRVFEIIVAKAPRDVVFKSERFQVGLTVSSV